MILIVEKEFIAAAFNLNHKAFIVYIVILNINFRKEIYPSQRAQIAYSKIDEVLTEVPNKYTNLVNIFLSKLVIELSKYTSINNHAIELIYD